ncbi:hypothetical protein [Streptomyces halobius]|uniref:Uncharacterized protein n=1 Tax=Streptomyces halobius TaxID=2879846 RepID=A0ABY4M3L1_9ACTN|nr:hypothetical protein [Streptomyces halobius]UQA91997.1 hypothetical protein K9S39_09170 [Streptomyces halobius]
MDEKTAMAARSRKQPARPPGRGRVRLREFEYIRHGTVSVTAATPAGDYGRRDSELGHRDERNVPLYAVAPRHRGQDQLHRRRR